MSSQRPLVIAAAAFGALALFGGGIWLGRASRAAAENADARSLPREREAAYRRLIDEANARIARQNQMLAAKAQPSIDANAAAAAAYRRAPGARLSRPPELVSYRGLAAYEVVLDRGTVYVDASTSEVLHDGTTPADDGNAAPLAMNGKRKSKHHARHDDDHEDDDD